MEKNMKQQFIKDLERDLKIKISALKKEKQVFASLGGLKRLMEDAPQKDGVVAILDKLRTFAEKQLTEQVEAYEDALVELQKIGVDEKDIETKGMVSWKWVMKNE